jgi:hypothetical protein
MAVLRDLDTFYHPVAWRTPFFVGVVSDSSLPEDPMLAPCLGKYSEHKKESAGQGHVFVLKRWTTGTELGGKLPYSVMTMLMYCAGVTS